MIVGCGDLTILLVGLGFHCFLLKCKEKLRHSLGRPSRSDFVQVEIVELAAEQVARVAEETSYIVLNGNYALQAGYSVSKDALAYETSDSEAAKTYVNVIAVKEGNENSDKIKALVDVLKSDEIKDFINEKYDGAVIPFEDSDDAQAEDADAADADESADAEADTADEAAEEADAE